MQRRDVIEGLSVISTVSLAGCSFLGSNGEGTTTADGFPSGAVGDSSKPSAVDVGTTLTTANSLRLTVDEFVITDRITVGDDTMLPDDGNAYHLIRLAIWNNGAEAVNAPTKSDLTVRNANGVRHNAVDSGSLQQPYSQPVTGLPFIGPYNFSGELPSNATIGGLLAFEVPGDITKPKLSVTGFQPVDGETLEWQLANDPQYTITYSVDVSGPGEPVIHREPYDYSITVTNTGGRIGQFRALVSVEGGSTQSEIRLIEATIGAGESLTEVVTVTPTDTETATVRVGPGATLEREITAPQFAFGESWVSPQGLNMTVRNVQTAKRIPGEDQSGDTQTVTPASGQQFLLFDVEVRNSGSRTGDDRSSDGEFVVEPGTGDEARAGNGGSTRVIVEITSPVSGSAYREPVFSRRRSQRQGRFAYEIPSSASVEDVSITIESTEVDLGDDGTHIAEWTAG